MSIDINRLPIPDWGLVCPRCNYPLRGLPEHRCPECGHAFRMEDVVKPWHRLRPPRFTGEELPLPDFDLHCRRCDQPLAGAVSRACPHCAAPFAPGDFLPPRAWFVIDQALAHDLALAGVESMLAAENVPFTRATGKALAEIYGTAPIVGSSLLAPTDFYFEVRWLLQRAREAIEQRRRQPQADWTCPACGEAVPGHFDVCWNCQTPRPGGD